MSTRQPAWPVYDIFTTADDGQVFIGVVTDTQWRGFCTAFGLDELLADPALATQAQRTMARAATLPRIAAVLRGWTRADLLAKCESLGLPFAPIGRPAELFDDPHLTASGGLLDYALPDGRPTRLPALPVAIDGARPALRRGLPAVGEHGRELAQELGYDADALDALMAAGVVAGA